MSEPIKAGDLVIVVKPKPCCGKGMPGAIFRVTTVSGGPAHCMLCGHYYIDSLDAQDETDGAWVEVNRLKRIPPLEELDDVKKNEEITA